MRSKKMITDSKVTVGTVNEVDCNKLINNCIDSPSDILPKIFFFVSCKIKKKGLKNPFLSLFYCYFFYKLMSLSFIIPNPKLAVSSSLGRSASFSLRLSSITKLSPTISVIERLFLSLSSQFRVRNRPSI